MSGFKFGLSFIRKGELDKILDSLLSDNINSYIDEKSFQQLLEIVENKHTKYLKAEAIESFLTKAARQTTWSGTLKTLMILHRLIHSVGVDSQEFFDSNKLSNIVNFEADKSGPAKNALAAALVPSYYNYLQKLSYNYEDFNICFFADKDFSKRLNEDNLSLLHFLSKLQNMLIYFLKLLPLLESSLEQFNSINLTKQLCYFCLTDCYHYYSYINHTINFMIKEVFNYGEHDSILFYEIYSEHIKLTKQIKQFFELRHSIAEFALKVPEFYTVDITLNREIETYVQNIKRQSPSKDSKNSETGNAQKSNWPNKTGSSKTKDKKLSYKTLSNVVDLCQVLPQITTPSFKLSEKQLFRPPSAMKLAKTSTISAESTTNPSGEDGKEGNEEKSNQDSQKKTEDVENKPSYFVNPFQAEYVKLPTTHNEPKDSNGFEGKKEKSNTLGAS